MGVQDSRALCWEPYLPRDLLYTALRNLQDPPQLNGLQAWVSLHKL